MPSALAIKQTHSDFDKAIWTVVWDFKKRYGGSVEDLYQDGCVCFMEAYRSFDKSKGACFHTWLRFILWKRFMDRIREAAKQVKTIRQTEELKGIPRMDRLDLKLLLDSLSDDAKIVAKIVLGQPPDISLPGRTKNGHRNISGMKKALVELLSLMGWAEKRIKKSFQEIQEALI